jgi:hypothetical protein
MHLKLPHLPPTAALIRAILPTTSGKSRALRGPISKYNRRTTDRKQRTRNCRGASSVLTHSNRPFCFVIYGRNNNFFKLLKILFTFFILSFCSLLFLLFFTFPISCLLTIQLVFYSSSFYYFSCFYPFVIPGDSRFLHNY